MIFQNDSKNGTPGSKTDSSKDVSMTFTVTAVTDEMIKADGNHPLAGETLHFDVEVVEVREA